MHDYFILLLPLFIVLLIMVGEADARSFTRRIGRIPFPEFFEWLNSHERKIAMRYGGSLYLDFRDWRATRNAHRKEV